MFPAPLLLVVVVVWASQLAPIFPNSKIISPARPSLLPPHWEPTDHGNIYHHHVILSSTTTTSSNMEHI